jgi:hypothetical protein
MLALFLYKWSIWHLFALLYHFVLSQWPRRMRVVAVCSVWNNIMIAFARYSSVRPSRLTWGRLRGLISWKLLGSIIYRWVFCLVVCFKSETLYHQATSEKIVTCVKSDERWKQPAAWGPVGSRGCLVGDTTEHALAGPGPEPVTWTTHEGLHFRPLLQLLSERQWEQTWHFINILGPKRAENLILLFTLTLQLA